ncbi:thioredoxin domain-containing protein [Robiginitalea sediminis]|uniref:thioredoxin family protein n=1 Tax=Robiginitalea sediminis TaxID=1982593 RepID=UPI000B4A74B8|nr:thioredoxin family protein [Robiginitalea sediminis]
MKIIISHFLLVILSLSPLLGQVAPDEVQMADGSRFLLGAIGRHRLQDPPYGSWFHSGYRAYTPDPALVQSLAPLLHDVEILVFLGTWCGDSRREVPRFLKILDEAGFPPSRLKLVAVDRRRPTYKTSPGGEERGKNILRVPTFILQRTGREVGRIVERPRMGLELDLCDILSCSPSVPWRD